MQRPGSWIESGDAGRADSRTTSDRAVPTAFYRSFVEGK